MKSGNESIKTIMSNDVRVIQMNQELAIAQEIMEQNNINHVVVLQEKKLAGMLSMTDLRRVKYLSDFADDKVTTRTTFLIFDIEEVMSQEVTTVDEDTTIKEVATIFSNANFHAIPVVKDEEIKGIISVKDVLKYYSEG